MEIIEKLSPNVSSRKGYKFEIVVLHITVGLFPGCLNWLTSKESQVSCHFLVTKGGVVYKLVDLDSCAWHAVRISNPSERARNVMKTTTLGRYVNPNAYSCGIEFEALESDLWTPEQMSSGVDLVKYLSDNTTHPFNGDFNKILCHQDITDYKPAIVHKYRDEIIRRLSIPEDFSIPVVDEVRDLLSKALDKLNQL
jgi:N-acetylmuramoyl-L-alanine amidase